MGMDIKFVALAVLAFLMVALVEGDRSRYGSSREGGKRWGGQGSSRGGFRPGGIQARRTTTTTTPEPEYDYEDDNNEEENDNDDGDYDEDGEDSDKDEDDDDDDDDDDEDDDDEDDDDDYDEDDDDEEDDFAPPSRYVGRNGRDDFRDYARGPSRVDSASRASSMSERVTTTSATSVTDYDEEDDEDTPAPAPAPTKGKISSTTPRALFVNRAAIQKPTQPRGISRMPVQSSARGNYRPPTSSGRSNKDNWYGRGGRRGNARDGDRSRGYSRMWSA